MGVRTDPTHHQRLGTSLLVDPEDPYFFDHPVDHIPGMALVGGFLDLFRSSGLGDPENMARVGISLRFPSFSELGPVELDATPDPAPERRADQLFTICARQDDRVVGEGEVAFWSTEPAGQAATPRRVAAPDYRVPAPQAMVHQRHADNVLISAVVAGDGIRTTAVRRPPRGHRLAASSAGLMPPELIVDAGRQLTTMIGHTEYDRPLTIKNILLRVDAEVPLGLRSDVYLRWTCRPEEPRRLLVSTDVVVGDPDGEPQGRVDVDMYSATPTVYRRMRGIGGRA